MSTDQSYITVDFNRLKLIDAVKKRPPLWDNSSIDREAKMKLWREVGEECFPDWHQLSKSAAYDRILYIQKKWRSFRDGYARELRGRKTGQKLTKCTYKYFKPLLFLGGYEELGINVEDLESAPNVDSDLITFEENHKLKKKREKYRKKMKQESITDDEVEIYDNNDDNDDIVQEEIEMPIYETLHAEAEKDTDKLFLLSFLPEIKQLPLNLKMWVRSQIANVMQEAVNCQVNKTKPGPISFKRPRKDSSSSD